MTGRAPLFAVRTDVYGDRVVVRRWFEPDGGAEVIKDFAVPVESKNAAAIADALNAQEARRKIPWVVCLCGSTRFREAFERANYELTMAEQIVLSVGWYPHAPDGHGEGVGHDSDEKIRLDELHKRKIDLADEVHVLNVGGYIGESTRSEIEYAIETGKTVSYLEES